MCFVCDFTLHTTKLEDQVAQLVVSDLCSSPVFTLNCSVQKIFGKCFGSVERLENTLRL